MQYKRKWWDRTGVQGLIIFSMLSIINLSLYFTEKQISPTLIFFNGLSLGIAILGEK